MKKIFIFICLFSILKVNGLNAKCDREIFSDIPSNKVTMTGWAGEFLNRQITGLTGHPEQSGFPFNRDGWINGLDYKDREFDGGLSWFPYEQVAYYLDGSLRCGFMTHNERLINNVKRNIYYLLSTRDSNGQFRIKDVEEDWWPLVVFIRMMVEEYKDTKDPNILDALVKHYKATYSGNKGTDFVFTGFSSRSLLHIENLCSIYDFTKDIWFLNTAERLYNTFEEKIGRAHV